MSGVGGHKEPLYRKKTQQLLAMTADEHQVMEYLMLDSVKIHIFIQEANTTTAGNDCHKTCNGVSNDRFCKNTYIYTGHFDGNLVIE